jgi:hypothetical protein
MLKLFPNRSFSRKILLFVNLLIVVISYINSSIKLFSSNESFIKLLSLNQKYIDEIKKTNENIDLDIIKSIKPYDLWYNSELKNKSVDKYPKISNLHYTFLLYKSMKKSLFNINQLYQFKQFKDALFKIKCSNSINVKNEINQSYEGVLNIDNNNNNMKLNNYNTKHFIQNTLTSIEDEIKNKTIFLDNEQKNYVLNKNENINDFINKNDKQKKKHSKTNSIISYPNLHHYNIPKPSAPSLNSYNNNDQQIQEEEKDLIAQSTKTSNINQTIPQETTTINVISIDNKDNNNISTDEPKSKKNNKFKNVKKALKKLLISFKKKQKSKLNINNKNIIDEENESTNITITKIDRNINEGIGVEITVYNDLGIEGETEKILENNLVNHDLKNLELETKQQINNQFENIIDFVYYKCFNDLCEDKKSEIEEQSKQDENENLLTKITKTTKKETKKLHNKRFLSIILIIIHIISLLIFIYDFVYYNFLVKVKI